MCIHACVCVWLFKQLVGSLLGCGFDRFVIYLTAVSMYTCIFYEHMCVRVCLWGYKCDINSLVISMKYCFISYWRALRSRFDSKCHEINKRNYICTQPSARRFMCLCVLVCAHVFLLSCCLAVFLPLRHCRAPPLLQQFHTFPSISFTCPLISCLTTTSKS